MFVPYQKHLKISFRLIFGGEDCIQSTMSKGMDFLATEIGFQIWIQRFFSLEHESWSAAIKTAGREKQEVQIMFL